MKAKLNVKANITNVKAINVNNKKVEEVRELKYQGIKWDDNTCWIEAIINALYFAYIFHLTDTIRAKFDQFLPTLTNIWKNFICKENEYKINIKMNETTIIDEYRRQVMDLYFNDDGTYKIITTTAPRQLGDYGCPIDAYHHLCCQYSYPLHNTIESAIGNQFKEVYLTYGICKDHMNETFDLKSMINDTIPNGNFKKLPPVLVVIVSNLFAEAIGASNIHGSKIKQLIANKTPWIDDKMMEGLELMENNSLKVYKIASAVYKQKKHFITRFKDSERVYFHQDGMIKHGYAQQCSKEEGFPYHYSYIGNLCVISMIVYVWDEQESRKRETELTHVN